MNAIFAVCNYKSIIYFLKLTKSKTSGTIIFVIAFGFGNKTFFSFKMYKDDLLSSLSV